MANLGCKLCSFAWVCCVNACDYFIYTKMSTSSARKIFSIYTSTHTLLLCICIMIVYVYGFCMKRNMLEVRMRHRWRFFFSKLKLVLRLKTVWDGNSKRCFPLTPPMYEFTPCLNAGESPHIHTTQCMFDMWISDGRPHPTQN